MDDIAAGIQLYRRAKQYGATVIDAYSAPLPSVTVTTPNDPRPERRLAYLTEHLEWRQLDKKHIDYCKFRELLFVFANSSSANHFHVEYAMEIFQGKRARPSFAPMVITTGNLMAFEVLRLIINRPHGADCRGYFFNPWIGKIERPRGRVLSHLIEWYAKRQLNKLINKGQPS